MDLQKFTVENFNIEKFLSLLKKAMMVKLSSGTDSSIVFKITPEVFSVQSALDTKSGIKFAEVYTNEMFEVDSEEEVPTLLLPYDEGKNLLSALQLFSEGVENNVVFNYATLNFDGVERNIVDNISINENNGKIVINVKCTHFEDVIFVEDEIKEKLVSEEEMMGEFEINENVMKKMTNMMGLDSDYSNLVSLISKGENIYLKGKNYKYQLCDYYSGSDVKVQFQKDHLAFLEKEYCKVIVYENRIVVRSMVNPTITIISLSESADS